MLIEQVALTNFLSFGPDGEAVVLGPLNVVIGPNGAGKSNLLEAIDLLRCAPTEVAAPIRAGGGVRDWLWKGGEERPTAALQTVLASPVGPEPLRYVLAFTEVAQRFHIIDERIEDAAPSIAGSRAIPHYSFQNGHPFLNVTNQFPGRRGRKLQQIDPNRSILAQRRDPDQYPEITWLAETLPRIRLYREWVFGRYSPPRMPQKADLPNEFLEPDASNLGLVLNRLRRDPDAKARVLTALRDLYDGIDDFDVQIEGGTVQVFLHEGRTTIPATRLSDGTLRYLCLLAILCHPAPPPLVCIEEPELGLHPDIMPGLARLLREASERCQLIVTTHSDLLVDAMTETPEAVLVCEKRNGATTLRRLSEADLRPWLAKYRLGELWTSGEIGGNRW